MTSVYKLLKYLFTKLRMGYVGKVTNYKSWTKLCVYVFEIVPMVFILCNCLKMFQFSVGRYLLLKMVKQGWPKLSNKLFKQTIIIDKNYCIYLFCVTKNFLNL